MEANNAFGFKQTENKIFLTFLFLIFYSTFVVGQNIEMKKQETSKPFIIGETIELFSNALNEIRTLKIFCRCWSSLQI